MLSSTISLVVLFGSLQFAQLAQAAPLPFNGQHNGLESSRHASKVAVFNDRHEPRGEKRSPRHRVYDEVEDTLPSTSNKHPVLDGYGGSGWESDIFLTADVVPKAESHADHLVGISMPTADSSSESRWSHIRAASDQKGDQSYLKYVFALIPPESLPATHQHSGHWIVQHVRPPFPIHQGYKHRAGHRKHSTVATFCHRLVALKDYSLKELRQLSAAAPSAAYISSRAGEVYKNHVQPTFAYIFCKNPAGFLMGGLFLVFLISVALREYLSARRAACLRRSDQSLSTTVAEKTAQT